ncbi:hypothetical protein [Bradyrhizobium sp. 76]|uniref:hypothetical protein n=1 Tax=Bradyrhizobium sp. 76 TaxID=2782680 RepID=UPI001FF770E3|nr:hypothetical protein [Bradyrhizobium sp. 76]MCK1405272.1 hypothetical protein [Bradyrhizobium sp. 76]
MPSLPDKKIIGALITLSIAQIIGGRTISLPPIIGRQIAADLQMTLSSVFAGTSALYLAMGLCVPWLATFRRKIRRPCEAARIAWCGENCKVERIGVDLKRQY